MCYNLDNDGSDIVKKIMTVLKDGKLKSGYLYFYVHFVVEVLCFYSLTKLLGDTPFLWFAPLLYDCLAFTPQSLIGYLKDKIAKIDVSYIGLALLILGLILLNMTNLNPYISLLALCLGNACLHVDGAEVTLKTGCGLLSPSAIFVSGGSFGVITGKLIANTNLSPWYLVILGLTAIPFIVLSHIYESEINDKGKTCKNFDYANPSIPPRLIILGSVFIVIVRGYMGYGLPTSWNKTILETIILYCAMGFGKALGGILSDAYGIRTVAIGSSILSLPFLILGDNMMFISLIGVLLFSMTMSITLAILVSVLKRTPGLAFGLTTIGLFLGTVPIFFFKITSTFINCAIIVVFTLLCTSIFKFILRGDKDE